LRIQAGYDIAFECPNETPFVLKVHVRPERQSELSAPEQLILSPQIPYRTYIDHFGNISTRLVAPAGRITLSDRFVIADSGMPELTPEGARQHAIDDLPDDALLYLLGSRYCDTQKLLTLAWQLFGTLPAGWPMVKAVLDYTHHRVAFGYAHARADRTAWEAHEERVGVCRDFAHLAITLCRCMNIPARYCTGYLGDIGVPRDPAPMDFSAWIEVYLGGTWYTLDARHNIPRIGRILMARGRDAADVAISVAFGPAQLVQFTVITDELPAQAG
jgi:transglutaminase-like putative cysteine protease